MDGRIRLSRAAWPLTALGLAGLSGLAWWWMGLQGSSQWGWFASHRSDPTQAWRWWSAALVHVNAAHLQSNLWAAAVVGAWGWTARVGAAQAIAWVVAWPLAQALLLTDTTSLDRYAGLSATLHAGAAIVCWHLLWRSRGARRAVGAAVTAAIVIKLGLEVPALQHLWTGWSGASTPPAQALPDAPGHVVAGHAHGCGVLAGVAAAALMDGIIGLCRRIRPAPIDHE